MEENEIPKRILEYEVEDRRVGQPRAVGALCTEVRPKAWSKELG